MGCEMNYEIDSTYLYNSDGVKLMDVSDALITTVEVNEEGAKFEKTLYPLNKETEFTATVETIPEVFNELVKQVEPNEYTIKYTKYVQARRHHKRRINKKWLKKYGYKERTVVIDGLKIASTEKDINRGTYRYTVGFEG